LSNADFTSIGLVTFGTSIVDSTSGSFHDTPNLLSPSASVLAELDSPAPLSETMSNDAGELAPSDSERVGEGNGDGAKTPFPFRAAAAAEGLPPSAPDGPWGRSWGASEGGAGGGGFAAAAAALDSSRCLSPGSWIRMPPRALPGPEAILAGKA